MLFEYILLILAFVAVNLLVFFLFGRSESAYDASARHYWRDYWMHHQH